MRRMMQKCIRDFISSNSHSALLLVDIGAWPFHDLLEKYPKRAKNIGIFEPGTISLAAGLSLSGIIPIVYGISPFIAQRSLEQIKLDFAYQKTGGNFLVTGASYDFSALGYSHYCPEDVITLSTIPGVEIVTPGTPSQFETLWKDCHANSNPTYFRMTDHCNTKECSVEFGKAAVLKRGTMGCVICAAETMDKVMAAAKELDVTVLYYTTIVPFDSETLQNEIADIPKRIYLCTPFYKGSITANVVNALKGAEYRIEESGVPLEILRNYGTKDEKDCYCGLSLEQISRSMKSFFYGK